MNVKIPYVPEQGEHQQKGELDEATAARSRKGRKVLSVNSLAAM